MQTLVECGCGLDVPQATVVACLLMVGKEGRVQKQVRTFGTTTREHSCRRCCPTTKCLSIRRPRGCRMVE